ncbi:hypothetical protein EV702DRAFT_1275987 [Suillus placidus]|uniref:Uncharacterized protein n=1 Tax=Suillus placidus TaxID=48579 RepID=A0A9P7A2D0_9AGAM|nr:hypothetical protein EV702DRAFT_1275987 [Suillus placidus]
MSIVVRSFYANLRSTYLNLHSAYLNLCSAPPISISALLHLSQSLLRSAYLILRSAPPISFSALLHLSHSLLCSAYPNLRSAPPVLISTLLLLPFSVGLYSGLVWNSPYTSPYQVDETPPEFPALFRKFRLYSIRITYLRCPPDFIVFPLDFL